MTDRHCVMTEETLTGRKESIGTQWPDFSYDLLCCGLCDFYETATSERDFRACKWVNL